MDQVTWGGIIAAVIIGAVLYFTSKKSKKGSTGGTVGGIGGGSRTDQSNDEQEVPELTEEITPAAIAEAARIDAQTPDIDKNAPSAALLKMTKAELLAEAKVQGVTANGRMKKSDILKKLK